MVGRLGTLCNLEGGDAFTIWSVLVVNVEGAKAESLLASSSDKNDLLKAEARGPGEVLGLRTPLSQERGAVDLECSLAVEQEFAGDGERVGSGDESYCAIFTPPSASGVDSASSLMALASIKDLAVDETRKMEEMNVVFRESLLEGCRPKDSAAISPKHPHHTMQRSRRYSDPSNTQQKGYRYFLETGTMMFMQLRRKGVSRGASSSKLATSRSNQDWK